MTTNIDDLITKLTERDAVLGDGRDVLQTANAQAAFYAEKRALAQVISVLRNAPADLARAEARIAELEPQRAAWIEKHDALTAEALAAVDPATIHGARERDKAYDRQLHVQQQLTLLNDGTLLRAPGVTYGRMDDINARLVELTERRDRAQRALDVHVAQAEALLAGETVSR